MLFGALSGLLAFAFALAALGLFGRSLRGALPRPVRRYGRNGLLAVRYLHSGDIRDYIAWWTTETAVLGGAFLLGLS